MGAPGWGSASLPHARVLHKVRLTLGRGRLQGRLSGGLSLLTTQLCFQRLPWDVAFLIWKVGRNLLVSHPWTARGCMGPRSIQEEILRGKEKWPFR